MVFHQDLFSCQRTTLMTVSSANCLEDVEQEQLKLTIRLPDTRRTLMKVANGTRKRDLVELDGIEPTTPCLQSRCSPN